MALSSPSNTTAISEFLRVSDNRTKCSQMIKQASRQRSKNPLSNKQQRHRLKQARHAEQQLETTTPLDVETFFHKKLDEVLQTIHTDVHEYQQARVGGHRQQSRAIQRRIKKRTGKDPQYRRALVLACHEIPKYDGTYEDRIQSGIASTRTILLGSHP